MTDKEGKKVVWLQKLPFLKKFAFVVEWEPQLKKNREDIHRGVY